MPWALAKDPENADRLNTVLYNLVESIVIGASLLEPYMPETSEKILKQLNADKRRVTELSNFGLYPSGNRSAGDSLRKNRCTEDARGDREAFPIQGG